MKKLKSLLAKITLPKAEMCVVAVIIFLIISLCFTVPYQIRRFNDAGGIKQIVVNIGKEVKDIKKQINEE